MPTLGRTSRRGSSPVVPAVSETVAAARLPTVTSATPPAVAPILTRMKSRQPNRNRCPNHRLPIAPETGTASSPAPDASSPPPSETSPAPPVTADSPFGETPPMPADHCASYHLRVSAERPQLPREPLSQSSRQRTGQTGDQPGAASAPPVAGCWRRGSAGPPVRRVPRRDPLPGRSDGPRLPSLTGPDRTAPPGSRRGHAARACTRSQRTSSCATPIDQDELRPSRPLNSCVPDGASALPRVCARTATAFSALSSITLQVRNAFGSSRSSGKVRGSKSGPGW